MVACTKFNALSCAAAGKVERVVYRSYVPIPDQLRCCVHLDVLALVLVLWWQFGESDGSIEQWSCRDCIEQEEDQLAWVPRHGRSRARLRSNPGLVACIAVPCSSRGIVPITWLLLQWLGCCMVCCFG